MALFQRYHRNDQLINLSREEPTTSRRADSFIYLIVGLGNVGGDYDKTRHNVGFRVVDSYAKKHKFPKWQQKAKFKAFITESFMDGRKVILAKPTTLMNLSGESIRAIKDFYKLKNNDITVIHDELDIPFGEIRVKKGGGSAGHNGLKSLIQHIDEDFTRLRIGIKNSRIKTDSADFVLSRFTATEEKKLPSIIKEVIASL